LFYLLKWDQGVSNTLLVMSTDMLPSPQESPAGQFKVSVKLHNSIRIFPAYIVKVTLVRCKHESN